MEQIIITNVNTGKVLSVLREGQKVNGNVISDITIHGYENTEKLISCKGTSGKVIYKQYFDLRNVFITMEEI